MDPRELRRRRLETEHRELMRLSGDVISIEPLGSPPHSKYRITFNIRTFTGARPSYSDATVCTLDIPPGYPIDAPSIAAISNPLPYHINWFTSGHWCHGSWDPQEPLANYVLRAARTLRNEPAMANEGFCGQQLRAPVLAVRKKRQASCAQRLQNTAGAGRGAAD